jgi:hypothetical protein
VVVPLVLHSRLSGASNFLPYTVLFAGRVKFFMDFILRTVSEVIFVTGVEISFVKIKIEIVFKIYMGPIRLVRKIRIGDFWTRETYFKFCGEQEKCFGRRGKRTRVFASLLI